MTTANIDVVRMGLCERVVCLSCAVTFVVWTGSIRGREGFTCNPLLHIPGVLCSALHAATGMLLSLAKYNKPAVLGNTLWQLHPSSSFTVPLPTF